jgi:membrane protease YdiL (CAAX protease family)
MWWWHQRRAWEKLKLNRTPRWKNVLVGVALVFILFPFVSWLYYWNTALLPDDWIGKDKLAMQEAFLRMRNGYELLVNLFLLGVVAALGEELIFRGIIQRIIQEWSSNVHVAAFVTAALFSFIHFQWEGFIARFVLGLLFCYLLVYTQNLWVPIIMHFVFNSVQVVIPYLYPETIDQLGEAKAIPVIAAVGSVVLFSIVFKLFILNSNHNYKIK